MRCEGAIQELARSGGGQSRQKEGHGGMLSGKQGLSVFRNQSV